MKIALGKIDLREHKEKIFLLVVLLVTIYFGRKIWDMQKAKSFGIKEQVENYKQKIELSGVINKLASENAKFKDISWSTTEVVNIMGEINKLSAKYDIEIFTFDPGAFENKNNYFTFTMVLNIRADYFNLVRFLTAIEELPTLTKIISLRITPTGETVQANLALKAFIIAK